MKATWLSWSEMGSPEADLLRVVERIAAEQTVSADEVGFLGRCLPEIATELAGQWVGLWQRTPQWQCVAQWGRPPASTPEPFFTEVLDRNAAGLQPSDAAGLAFVACPVDGVGRGGVLAVCGRSLTPELLPTFLAASRALGHGLGAVRSRAAVEMRADRLRTMLRSASRFARTRQSEPLLKLIAGEACRLLACDRSSIFVWDKERKEVVARPAIGLEELRLPDRTGVVGDVLRSGQPVRVDDTAEDARFGKQVDAKTGYSTRNLLAVPLRSESGEVVGVFEVMNKQSGGFTDADEESLTLFAEQAAASLENTREREDLIRSREQLAERVTAGVRLIGESSAMVALRATVDRLAATDLPVLLLGESGTGKEVVAQTLHYHGPRSAKPFVAVNCAALTESLLESELFGHEAGAFTDARETRPGKFELADGGTLFLDEIGDMSLAGQAKLLRVLEQKVITRVRGSKPIPVDVRIVAATNANLRDMVRQNKFREDLYYRLSVVTQRLPPLRERPDDILPLAEHFLKAFSVQSRRPNLQLASDAKRRLQAHHWPGNIRELRNLMERLAFLCPNDKIEADDLQFTLSPDQEDHFEPSFDLGLNDATKEFQREFIDRAVQRVKGNMSDAAKLLGLHRSNLYRKMRQLDMEVTE